MAVTPDTNAGVMPPSVQAEAVQSGRWRCTFRYAPGRPVQTVCLAGVFNNWNPTVTPFEGPDAQGDWTATIELPAGVHLYKFVVDGNWIPDPKGASSEDDGHGGRNSVLRLGYVAQLGRSNAQVGDGRVDDRALEHVPTRPLYLQRLAGRRALIRLRTLTGDVERAYVAVRDGAQFEMAPIVVGDLFTLWEATAQFAGVDWTSDAPAEYTFVLADGDVTCSSPATYEVPVSKNDVFHTPDWAKNAVWYQIMVDRFRNGEPANDRDPVNPWTDDWFTPTPLEKQREQDGQTFYEWYVFDRQYGGDIQGLMAELPYLKELGINAIYLMPMFKAESNHKYNAETYLHIDDHFGFKGDYDAVRDVEDHNDPNTWQWTKSDQLFLQFIQQAHKMGFKVIIDGVFNHVGTAHPAFQDVVKNKQASRYADWFNVTSWEPFKYEGWFGHDALPVFKKAPQGYASDQVKQYVFNVTRRWMDPNGDGDPSDGIDGWRLDVPNEVPAPFWVEWRELVKSINPDAYITGEIWERADFWLDGSRFDAVMNYEFAKAVVPWVFNEQRKITTSEFDRRLRELRLAYPIEATQVVQNLIASHDTDRAASMAFNPDRTYDQANRVQGDGKNYNNSKPDELAYRKQRLAVLIQMTYVGAPMFFYGDEVGIWGADDPTCRKPMLWKDLEPYENPEVNRALPEQLAFYKEAIALRNAHPALRTGSFRTLLADDELGVWAFLRSDEHEQLAVVINATQRDAQAVVPLPATAATHWQGVYGAQGDFKVEKNRLEVAVPALGGVVLQAVEN